MSGLRDYARVSSFSVLMSRLQIPTYGAKVLGCRFCTLDVQSLIQTNFPLPNSYPEAYTSCHADRVVSACSSTELP